MIVSRKTSHGCNSIGVLETLRLQRLRNGIRTLKIHIRYSHSAAAGP